MTPEAHVTEARPSAWSIIGWGAYLACSWTWCIGMFLPVLLVRDFGPWGYVAFAVPNVLGAAALAWVMRNPDSSRRLVANHAAIMTAFSAVTIIFHAYFVGWLLADWLRQWAAWLGALIVAGLLPVVFGTLRLSMLRALALAIILGTAAIAWWAGANFERFDPGQRVLQLVNEARLPETSVLWLAGVSAFGFLLCPYLDLTFHRARRSTGIWGGRAAFALGFGVFFLFMILLTLGYAGYFIYGHDEFRWLILAHILIQGAFTVGVHLKEVLGVPDVDNSGWGCIFLPIALLVLVFTPPVLVFLGAEPITAMGRIATGMSAGEMLYRLFMAFYGLVFPAYVWLIMLPRNGHSGVAGQLGRRKLRVYWIAVLLALPLFWMGFIERQTWLLAPGLAIVLFARALLPAAPRPSLPAA